MPKFFDFGGSHLFSLDRVRKIEFRDGSAKHMHQVTLYYHDEDRLTEFESYYGKDDLDKVLATVVPATPGYEFVQYWFEDTKPSVKQVMSYMDRTPIVAWRMGMCPVPEPIGIDSCDEGFDSFSGVLCPSGQVINWGDDRFKTLEEWAQGARDRWDRWHETVIRQKQKSKARA